MKKLMLALTLAAVGSAFAIESSNIVGYSQNGLVNGAVLMTSQFQSIGATGFKLDELRPSSYGVSLYSVDAYGRPLASYLWTDCGGEDWDTADVWVDEDTNEIVTDVEFLPGEALFVKGNSSSDNVQSAGQVRTSDVDVQLCNGATLAGNPFPCSIKLNDMLPTAYGVSLYSIDAYGRPLDSYLWTDCGGEDWDTADVWVNEDTNEIIDDTVTIAPGAALFIKASDTSTYIAFPTPETIAE